MGCFEHSQWEPLDSRESKKTITPSINPNATGHRIHDNVWEALVGIYDRYMQIALTMPLKGDMPNKISDMEIFFNRIVVIGIIAYDEQLKPIEKDLGITK